MKGWWKGDHKAGWVSDGRWDAVEVERCVTKDLLDTWVDRAHDPFRVPFPMHVHARVLAPIHVHALVPGCSQDQERKEDDHVRARDRDDSACV